MTDISPFKADRSFLNDPILRLAAVGVLLLFIAFIASRAPTSFDGKLPFIGEFIPLKLNVVYLIVLGPIAATCLAACLWYLASERTPQGAERRTKDSRLIGACFFLFTVLTTLLSIQYFIELAPEALCGTRPHFDFLWTSVPGTNRIHHCMSGTQALNATSPFYFRPQIAQSWGHVLWPVLTAFCLYKTWQRWRPVGAV